MDINDVIEWLGSRDDIVIADKNKFIADMREQLDTIETEGDFLKDVRKYNDWIRKKYTGEDNGNHLLVIATDDKTTSTVWGGSIAGLAAAYASIAANDHDYVELLEVVSKVLLIDSVRKKFLGHDTD